MSNVTIFNQDAVPAFVKNRTGLSAVAKALAGSGGSDGGKRISIKGGVFRLYSAGKEVAAIEERYLDVVIVAAAPKIGRVFYMKSYDGEANAPDCWSGDGEKPSADASNKQAATCTDCAQNVAGSGQGNSRACRYQQRVAVVLANDMEGDVLQLTLPAKSIFGKEEGDNRPLQAYARFLLAQTPNPVDPSEVVTRLKFDTQSESPKLFFKAMRWLTEEEYPNIVEKGQTPEAQKAIAMFVTNNVAAPLAIGGKRPMGALIKEEDAPAYEPIAAKAKKAKAEPVAEDDGEEPTVRKEEKKPSAVPAKKSSLAAMVDDWDE